MHRRTPGAFAQRGCDAEQASELDETEEVLRVELPTDQQMAPPLNPGKEAFDTSQLLRAFPGHKADDGWGRSVVQRPLLQVCSV
jgi:hypothetical protein